MTGGNAIRIASCAGAAWRSQGVAAGATTEGWQDKRAHGAAQADGCFCSCFWRVPHRAALSRTVRSMPIFFNLHTILHRARPRHVR